MIRLFWTQNKNPSLSNTVINADGEVMTYDKSNKHTAKLVNDLLDYQETSILKFQKDNLYIREYPKGGIFISSNFSNKDDKGRKMAFMFFTQNTKKEGVIDDLLFFSGLVNRTLKSQDIGNINKELSKRINKENKQIIKLIAVAIAIVIIYMLWKKLS